MPTGTVKRFNPKRGFGFIQPSQPDGGEDDVFVYQRDIQMNGFRCLYVGEEVTYDEERGDKGVKAINVKVTKTVPERDAPHRPTASPVRSGAVHNPDKLSRMLDKLLEYLSSECEDMDPILTKEDVIAIYRS